MPKRHNDDSLRPQLWYKLDGTIPVPGTVEEAEQLLGDAAVRRIAFTEIAEGVKVSTIFLCLNHNDGGGPPLLFETMLFWPNSPYDNDLERCATWGEAEQMHQRMCDRVTRLLQK